MAERRIVVVGGGPKAAAIAAKAEVLNRLSRTRLQVTIIEQSEIGANWTGSHGYTDGEARLCTPAERDLGFPYDVGIAGQEVAAAMHSGYSWGAFQIERGRSDAQSGFKNWVNRGRLPPTHAEFAAYIRWAVERSGAKVEIARVERIEGDGDGWLVHRVPTPADAQRLERFDGVVFTGPGPPLRGIEVQVSNDRIADGRSFWDDPDGFLAQAKGSEDPLIILGAGGTAAAIAARATRAREVGLVLVIGDPAALFTRVEAFFENQIFTDAAVWKKLDKRTRRKFTARLNRGVVWAAISDELARSPKVRFEPARGKKVSVRQPLPGKEEIAVEYERGGETFGATGSLAVDASGFDAWWFAPMLPDDLRDRITGATPEEEKEKRRKIQDEMTANLALFPDGPAPIHAPMLSQAVGPGLMSLMALGAMSDLVLNRYTGQLIDS